MELKEKVKKIGSFLDEKLAKDIVILDMDRISLVADYFVIATGTSARQTKALKNYLEEEMKKHDIRPIRSEGYQKGEWILVDFGDIVVHLFTEEKREYYDLERLWKDAARLEY